MTPDVLPTVTHAGEPDVVDEVPADGISRLFGRDEDASDILIWSAIPGTNVRAVTGPRPDACCRPRTRLQHRERPGRRQGRRRTYAAGRGQVSRRRGRRSGRRGQR